MLQELGLYDESSFLPVGLVFQIITQLSHLGIKPGAKVELLPLSLISILSPRLVHVSTRFPLPSRTVSPGKRYQSNKQTQNGQKKWRSSFDTVHNLNEAPIISINKFDVTDPPVSMFLGWVQKLDFLKINPVHPFQTENFPGLVRSRRFDAKFPGNSDDLGYMLSVALGHDSFVKIEIVFQSDTDIASNK